MQERAAGVPSVICGMVYQAGAAIAKSLFPALGATGTAGLRILLSAIVLCALWRPWRRLPGVASLRAIVPYGVSLGVAVAIEFTGPLALAVCGSRRGLDLLWAALVVIGLALLLDPGGALHRLDPLGVACARAAGLCGRCISSLDAGSASRSRVPAPPRWA